MKVKENNLCMKVTFNVTELDFLLYKTMKALRP